MADLVVPNPNARRLLWDVQVIKDAIEHLPETTYAGQDALNTATLVLNAFADGASDSGSDEHIQRARVCAQALLGDDHDGPHVYDRNVHGESTVTSIGHCHIDTAWLWTYGETRRKIARSWSAQCDLLDRYPEHRICISQAVQFQWLMEDHPALWERVQGHIKQGGIQPIGGVSLSEQELSIMLLVNTQFVRELTWIGLIPDFSAGLRWIPTFLQGSH